MDQATQIQQPAQEEFNLLEVFEELWRLRIVVAIAAMVCAAAGVVAGLLIPKQYVATVTISPVLDDSTTGSMGGLSALASQYSGLASLAGISLPEKGKKDESLATLQSELLTEAYIRDNNLLPVLFSRKWNAKANRWAESDPKEIPTLWQANAYFKKKIRDVSEDRKSGLVELSIRWKNPVVAAKWANDLVRITNDYLRAKAIRESDRNIKYLNEQAAGTSVVEAQRVIYTLLENEINKEMIAKGRDEYALKVIDPAFVPEKPVTPGPATLGAAGAVFGILLSAFVVFARKVLRG